MELERKLVRHAGEGDDLEGLLDWLEASKFLSQTRFSESLVHRRAARFGNNRILSELQSHHIDPDALGAIKADLAESETTRARDIWARKFGNPPQSAAERAKQMRFLQQRGFSHTAIKEVMRAAGIADDEGDPEF